MLCTIWFLHRIVFKSLESYPVWKNKAHHQAWQIKRWIYSRVGSFFFLLLSSKWKILRVIFVMTSQTDFEFLKWLPFVHQTRWVDLKHFNMWTHVYTHSKQLNLRSLSYTSDRRKKKIVNQFCDGFTSTSKMVAPERMKNHRIGCVFF